MKKGYTQENPTEFLIKYWNDNPISGNDTSTKIIVIMTLKRAN